MSNSSFNSNTAVLVGSGSVMLCKLWQVVDVCVCVVWECWTQMVGGEDKVQGVERMGVVHTHEW